MLLGIPDDRWATSWSILILEGVEPFNTPVRDSWHGLYRPGPVPAPRGLAQLSKFSRARLAHYVLVIASPWLAPAHTVQNWVLNCSTPVAATIRQLHLPCWH